MSSKQIVENPGFLTFDAIIANADVTEKVIDVPEWGGKVRIRSLSKRQQREISKNARNADGEIDDAKFEKEIMLAGLVEPAITPEQHELLLDRSIGGYNRVITAIVKNSGMSDDAVTDEERNFRPEQ